MKKDKIKELEQSGSTQTQKDTGNNTNTTDEASETKSETHKRTIWLTKNVIDDLKKFKNKTHFDYIKWIQSLINPDTKIRTDKVWGAKNNATAFEIKTVANGGPRMYSAPYTATQMLIFSIGDKDTQKQKDIVNAKRVAKIYDKLNDELKPEHSTLPQITLSVQIGREKFTETLYNFDAAETRRDLGLEPKAKEEQSNTVITKQQVDQLSADGQNGAFQTVSYNDQKTTPKPKNRWQPVEELIQIYCEKHPDANKQEITEKVYAGCKELEDKEYLRKTDGGEYVVFDTDADGFIDLLLSGKSKEQHEPDVQQQDLDISGLKPKSAEEWAQSYLYSDGTPISTIFMELILEQVLPRNKPFAESIGFKEIKENDDDKYIIVDTESFTKFLYKQRERLVSLSMAARITFINKQALIDKCDTLEPDPKYFFYTGAYYDNIKYYFVRDNLHEFVATYFAPEDKIATRWSLEQLAKRMKTTKDKIMPVIRANADSELIQQCIIQDGFFAPMYLDAFKELYKMFYQNKANERKQKQQARILKAQEEEEKKYENVGMQQTLDELVDTFKDSESGKPKYTKSFMYLVLNTLMTDLYYRDLIEKHNFKDDIKYKKHLDPDKDSFTYTIGNIRSFERLLEKFAIRLIPIPQVAQQYGISQEALLEKCNSLGTNMAPDYGIPYFYKAPYFQGEEMYQFYMIKQNIHQFMQKYFSDNANKELWKIDQLAQYLAQYYPGVTIDIVKKINGGLHGAGATHGTWFTGHGVGRRFLAEYAGQYKSEYGAIIQQMVHLDDSQIKSEADVEQPQQPTNTPVVDVAPTIVPEPEPTPEPQPTTFGGMLGVKTYQAKLNALMQLIEQKQQEKAMAENEMQSLDKEIEELNQQAIDKIKARDTTDSVGKLLEESKVKQHKLDQASARVKQLTYDIDSLQTRLEEGTKKLQQYNDAVNKKKAADQAAQQAADEVQMANNALQQFLQDF